jgi:TctA family transporter
MLFLTLYMFVVQMIFDISDVSKALFAVIFLIVLPSLCYAAASFQLVGSFGRVLRVWNIIVYMAVIFVAVIMTYASKRYVPVVCLAAMSGCVGLVAYFRVKKGFTRVDWLQVRTITWPKT